MRASCPRSACGFWLCVYTKIVPSALTSATAIVGPIGACFMYGISYEAVSFLADARRAAGTSPLLIWLVVTGVDVQSTDSRRCLNRFALPGRPFQSVHLVVSASACDARIASHSLDATTPTRFPLTTTCEFGNR